MKDEYIFWVNPNIDMTEIEDSLMLDSGQTIATLEYKGYIASLEVVGDVKVVWNDQFYTRPSEFPEELKKKILDTEPGRLYEFVLENNWFEVFLVDPKYPSVPKTELADPECSDPPMLFDILYETIQSEIMQAE